MDPLTGINILIADDNPLNQKIASMILKRYGSDVGLASNGRQVLEMMKQTRYDIILMDLQMPEMDGITTTRFLRNELKNNIPVIALSADTYAGRNDAFLGTGIDEFVSKPFNSDELCRLVLKLVQDKKFQES